MERWPSKFLTCFGDLQPLQLQIFFFEEMLWSFGTGEISSKILNMSLWALNISFGAQIMSFEALIIYFGIQKLMFLWTPGMCFVIWLILWAQKLFLEHKWSPSGENCNPEKRLLWWLLSQKNNCDEYCNDAPLRAVPGSVNVVNINNSLHIQMSDKENQRSLSVMRQTVKTKKRFRSREPSRILLRKLLK